MLKIQLSIILFFFSCLFCIAQPTTFVGKQSNSIWRLVKKYHYAPKQLDDNLSNEILENFISYVDADGFYLLQSDIDELQEFKTTIDNEIEGKTTVFFKKMAHLFRVRLIAVDSLIDVLSKESFDFDIKESLSFSEEEYPDYVQNYDELKERWRKWMKYSILDELFTYDYFDDPMNEDVSTLKSKIGEAEIEIIKFEKSEISSYLLHPAGYENYLATFYLDAIATCFDPHTTYFSNIERDFFEAELSGENLVFGFSVEEDDKGIIRIEGLMPGSPAWNSNEINKGDQLLSLRFSDGQYLDMANSGIDEIRLLFQNTTANEITLELKKVNGQKITVVLVKGEVYIEEDVIKNVILNGDKKIGYITLPDFYMDWDDDEGLGCANDVAKTIVKLKKENIEGLILDLRNNGGGSLREAIDLAGIFIDWGPLSIQQDADLNAVSLKDMNKGTIYTGPLVILVNGLSASASELFTAAMQDYNRAIIVGSPTYGKGTGQIILPVDPAFSGGYTMTQAPDEDYGYLKLTTNKYYRITKNTHQLKGVIPNVMLKDVYDIYDYKESTYENALSSDSVDKKVYFTPFSKFPDELAQNSKRRMKENTNFIQLISLIDSIKITINQDEVIPLEFSEYLEQEREYELFLEKLFGLVEYKTESFKATNNQFDLEIMKMNSYRKELNEAYLLRIEEDIYIDEAYKVILDYINLR